VGALLRGISLDELPQLWNVVRGEMSLIGPRPTLRYQVDQVTTSASGTGSTSQPGSPAGRQIQVAAKLSWAERIELDLWYVEHHSPLVDAKIVARTPRALFGGTYRERPVGWSPTQ